MMEPKNINWHLGELVMLPEETKQLKNSGSTVLEQFIGSRYICIREAKDGQRGILLKVLGKYSPEKIMMVDGHPFCKDDRETLFTGSRYFSYPFPTSAALKEVLDIVGNNPSLHKQLEETKMHINTQSKFWVNEASSHLFVIKRPQCYDAKSDLLSTTFADDEAPYRVTMVYFNNGLLSW